MEHWSLNYDESQKQGIFAEIDANSSKSKYEEMPIDCTELERVDMAISSDVETENGKNESINQRIEPTQPEDEGGYPLPEIVIPTNRKRKNKWKIDTFLKTKNRDRRDQTINVLDDIMHHFEKSGNETEDAESDSHRASEVSNLGSEITTDPSMYESRFMPKIVRMLDHGCAWMEGYDCGLGHSTLFGNSVSNSRRYPYRHKFMATGEDIRTAIQRQVSFSILEKETTTENHQEPQPRSELKRLISTKEKLGKDSGETSEGGSDQHRTEVKPDPNPYTYQNEEESQMQGSLDYSNEGDNSLLESGNNQMTLSGGQTHEQKIGTGVSTVQEKEFDGSKVNETSGRFSVDPTTEAHKDRISKEIEPEGKAPGTPVRKELNVLEMNIVSPLSVESDSTRKAPSRLLEPPVLSTESNWDVHSSSSGQDDFRSATPESCYSDKPLHAPRPNTDGENDIILSGNRTRQEIRRKAGNEDNSNKNKNASYTDSKLSNAYEQIVAADKTTSSTCNAPRDNGSNENVYSLKHAKKFVHPRHATAMTIEETVDLTDYDERVLDERRYNLAVERSPNSYNSLRVAKQDLSAQGSRTHSYKKKVLPKEPEGHFRGCGGPEQANAKVRRSQLGNVVAAKEDDYRKHHRNIPDPSTEKYENQKKLLQDVIDLTDSNEFDFNIQHHRLPLQSSKTTPSPVTTQASIHSLQQDLETLSIFEQRRIEFLRAAQDARSMASALRQMRLNRDKKY